MKEKLFISDSRRYVQVKEFLKNEFMNTKCGNIEIQETPLGIRIVVHTTSPGMIIGTKGEKIKGVTRKLKERFDLKNPQIDTKKIKNPDLDPNIIAKNIAVCIERGLNYKKVGNYYLSKVMNAGARGCEIVIAGKISGEKARKERFAAGFVEKSGTRDSVKKGFFVANPKLGNIGIKVFIVLKEPEEEKLKEKPDEEADKPEEPKTEKEKTGEVPEKKLEKPKDGKKAKEDKN